MWNSRYLLTIFLNVFSIAFNIEYLAPEFIFNLGHDSSCDIWALGVLIYEMFMFATPFAPAKPDNVTELFTNIATVKVSSKSFYAISYRVRNPVSTFR